MKKTILEVISKSINTGKPLGEILLKDYPQFVEEEPEIKIIEKRYLFYKNANSLMDYDDLLVNLKNLLQKDDPIRKNYPQNIYKSW